LLFNGHTKPSVDCYRCHNGDARGSGRGPDLAKVAAAMPVEGMVAVIEKGKGFMPAFGDATTPEERQQIALWLRTTFAGPDATKPAPAVEVEPVSEPAPAPATTPEPSATPAANAQPPAR
jgi:mono/diheme cytochrome c family protein